MRLPDPERVLAFVTTLVLIAFLIGALIAFWKEVVL